MTPEELKDQLIQLINRQTTTLNASSIDASGAVIGIEHGESGELFFLEITPA